MQRTENIPDSGIFNQYVDMPNKLHSLLLAMVHYILLSTWTGGDFGWKLGLEMGTHDKTTGMEV